MNYTTNTPHTVQHIILSTDSGIAELPTILNSSPAKLSSSPRPVAIVTGAAYTKEDVLRMQSGLSPQSSSGVFWLCADMAKMADMPPPGAGPAYGQKMNMRVKEALMKLKEEGRLGMAKAGEVVLY
jgi:hypothetical protein